MVQIHIFLNSWNRYRRINLSGRGLPYLLIIRYENFKQKRGTKRAGVLPFFHIATFEWDNNFNVRNFESI